MIAGRSAVARSTVLGIGLLLPAACGPAVSGQTLVHRWDGLATNDQAGAAVAGGRDVNGDGLDDIVVGMPRSDVVATDAGRVRVHSGLAGALLHDFPGTQAGASFGAAVACVGDLDNDGRSEILVGAPLHDTGGIDCGRAYLFSGKTGATLFSPGGS